MATLTVEIPNDVLEILVRQARDSGTTLQDLLLTVIKRQAATSRARDFLAEVRRELAAEGGAGPDAPDAADIIRSERRGEFES